jgi:hypothetical protein
MTRTEFTKALARLLTQMELDGEQPILDYVKRSTEEQQRLFGLKLSKLDGVNKISAHQRGTAADIYLLNSDGSIEWTKEKAAHYHHLWEQLGGKPMIDWDLGHFEG